MKDYAQDSVNIITEHVCSILSELSVSLLDVCIRGLRDDVFMMQFVVITMYPMVYLSARKMATKLYCFNC